MPSHFEKQILTQILILQDYVSNFFDDEDKIGCVSKHATYVGQLEGIVQLLALHFTIIIRERLANQTIWAQWTLAGAMVALGETEMCN